MSSSSLQSGSQSLTVKRKSQTAWLLGLFLLILAGSGVLLASRIDRIADVWILRGSSCDLELYTTQKTLALSCQGQDMIRLWPLPFHQPWYEDHLQEPAGLEARLEDGMI